MRWLRLLALFWSTSAAAEAEYRLNFFFRCIISTGTVAGSIFSLSLLYGTGYTIEGWSWDQALLLVGIFSVLQGFMGTFLTANLGRIVSHVQQGTLDFVLLQPLDSQFHLSTRRLGLWGVPDLLLGVGVLVYAGSRLDLPLSAWALLPPILAMSCTLLYALWFMMSATSIWFVKIYNLVEVLRGLLDAGRFPIAAFPPAWRVFFTFVVPVAFLTTVPAQVVLGRADASSLLMLMAFSGGMLVVSRLFWRFALRYYTSASS